ncbi:MAG: glycosyl hydrolase [Kiritimatiellia bacterium]
MKIPFLLALLGAGCAAPAADSIAPTNYLQLVREFADPPAAARPWTWWHWMNGNVTKAGITADLEAMQEIGLGGAQIFDAKLGALSAGNVRFNSPLWYEMLDHAAREAKRLGLTLGIANCSGWSLCGGPWITPEDSMKVLEWTETTLRGGERFDGKLPRPRNLHGFYRDIAVLAIPDPPAEQKTMALAGGVMTAPAPQVKTISFAHDFAASGFSSAFAVDDWQWQLEGNIKVEVSNDGKTFTPLCHSVARLFVEGCQIGGRRYFTFPRRVFARHFRFTFDFPARPEVRPQSLRLEPGVRIEDLPFKNFQVRGIVGTSRLEPDADQRIKSADILDLTHQLGADDSFAWHAPSGNWTLLRIGYAANGRKNHPATEGGRGLEIDKLSKRALDVHFDSYIAKLPPFDHVLVDSYEAGSMNWTEGMESAFHKHCGYSIKPYLAVLTGRVVDSMASSEKFLADFRRTIAKMFAQNFAGHFAQRCHERGLRLALEPYGSCPSVDLDYGQYADLPMGEFWSSGKSGSTVCGNARMIGYLAHFWGRDMAGMESFTAGPEGTCGRWQGLPCQMKTQGDRVYTEGVNHIVYHRFVHQPWVGDKYVPGLTMGRYGTHFDRTQTWWKEGREWVRYQSRCQYLLKCGRPVSDVLICLEEVAPQHPPIDNCLPYGYAWDVCSQAAAKAVKREADGTIVSPGGARYRLMLGDDWKARAAAELAKAGLTPDFTCSLQQGDKIGSDSVTFIHRDYGEYGDGYFVAYPRLTAARVECSFRISGRRPWLWNPMDGSIAPADHWREQDGRTYVTIDFEPADSVFVMFPACEAVAARAIAAAKPRLRPRGVALVEGEAVPGPWRVSFSARYRDPPKPQVMGTLSDWTENADREVRYFSGTATYAKTLESRVVEKMREGIHKGKRCLLDLGTVYDFATVTVGRKTFQPLWKEPYVVDVTEAIKAGGPDAARLEIRVTNRWPNRLIGDDFLPEDCRWQAADKPQELVEIPAWVKAGEDSPANRKCFTSWKHWNKDDKLLPSGLIGPVRIGLVDSKH